MDQRKVKPTVSLCVALVAAAATALSAAVTFAGATVTGSPQTSRAHETRRTRAHVNRLFGDKTVERHAFSDGSRVARVFRVRSAVDGTTTSIAVFLGTHTSARRIRVALYTDTQKRPKARLATGSRRALRRGRWNVVTMSRAPVRAGHTYWIALLPSGGRLALRGRTRGCGQSWSRSRMNSLPAKWTKGRRQAICEVSAYVRGQTVVQATPTPPASPSPGPGSPGSPAPSQGQTKNCAPPAGQTMTNTVSHLCGFADTTNTGVPAGTTLYQVPAQIAGPTPQTGTGWSYSNGAITVAAGGVLTNVQFDGSVHMEGASATVKDSDIETSGTNSWAIQLRHAPNATIVANNLHGVGIAAPSGCDSAIRDIYADSDNLTVKNNNVWYCADPMNNIADGGLIEQNYFHDIGAATTGNHFEDIQLEPGNGSVLTMQDNTFFNQNTQTASIALATDNGGTETNRVITHNLLAGGGYCFYGGGTSTHPATNITFTNNSFGVLYYPKSGYYGPRVYWSTGNGNTWSGNIWDNSGAPAAS